MNQLKTNKKEKALVDKEILIMAFRYSLGRMTFAPTVVVENIKNNIEIFNEYDFELIQREILETKNLGMDCDVNTWLNFSSYLDRANKE